MPILKPEQRKTRRAELKSLADEGLTIADAARRLGVTYESVWKSSLRYGVNFPSGRKMPKDAFGARLDFTEECSGTEAAISSAFRQVIGWCPIRDGKPLNSCVEPLPKREIYVSDAFVWVALK